VIPLDATSNAVQIFQTLNTRGRGLSEIDLVRSSLFVGVKELVEAEGLHERYWEPMEKRLPGKTLEEFLRTDLIRGGRPTTARRVYEDYQAVYGTKLGSAAGVEEVLKQLGHQSKAYRAATIGTSGAARRADSVAGDIARSLQDLQDWQSLPAAPLILEAELARQGGAT
jgi:hypothetical protein